MKAKLRSGKQGAKGRVKKYADGGMAEGKIAPPNIAAMSASAPDPRMASMAGSFGSQSPDASNIKGGGVDRTNMYSNPLLTADTTRPTQSGSMMALGTPPSGTPAGLNLSSPRPPSADVMAAPPPAITPTGTNVAGASVAPTAAGRGKYGYGGMGGRFGRGMGGLNRGDTGRPSMVRPGTGGPMAPPAPRPMTAGAQVMPGGRAFKKGGMVGCDWSPKSSATMRGAARPKGGKK